MSILEVLHVRPRRQGWESFLVRIPGSRAVVVNVPKIPYESHVADSSEFTMFCLISAAGVSAGRRGWKSAWVWIRVGLQETVYYTNSAPCWMQPLGKFEDLTQYDHFLNDTYYSPPGFWIKNSPYREVSNEAQPN